MTGWCESVRSILTQPRQHNILNTRWLTKFNDDIRTDDIGKILRYLRSGKFKIVSDGSFCPDSKLGTAAWILELGDEGIQIHGATQVTGASEHQCTHRSELMGIIGGIYMVDQICKKYGIWTT